MPEKIVKSEEEWKKELTPEQYRILREKGTEPPGTGEYYHSKEKGTYLCAACGQELFSSEAKYESGSGWPSFWEPVSGDMVETETDTSIGMQRVEVMCGRCGSHLGHVFDDGPRETTGKRFCINSASLKLKKKE
ncbi:MAG: hypothetical protein RL272_697 [Candidatus Parcubacteria bacterium]|jgi:peptide-methionine (R)-S-oxide reductase